MFFKTIASLAAFILAGPAMAAPAGSGATSFTGDITHYSPSVGLGACGHLHQDNEYVVALGHDLFDASTPNGNPNNNPLCGRSIRVSHEGKSVTIQVVDRCAACGTHDLDLSPVAFQVFKSLDVGRFQASWDWA